MADGKVRFDFTRDEQNKLVDDAYIIDECSMLEIPLAWKFFRALPRHARVVLVGDVNQLPPVGPGAFLMDLIASGAVPTTSLTKILRQDGGGALVKACHAIKDGREPRIANGPEDDLRFLDVPEAADIMATVLDLVAGGIAENPKFARLDPLRDIQVISPTRDKGDLSCLALNKALQGRLNPPTDPALAEPGKLRPGDKVIQTRNDYERDIVNGDIGYVKRIAKDPATNREMIEAEFEDTDGKPFMVSVPRWENNLELGYALTVHKYQGSEAPVVIIPLHSSQPSMLMQRNLIYTAISRARQLCVLVGQREMLGKAVRRVSAQNRVTHLKDFIQQKER